MISGSFFWKYWGETGIFPLKNIKKKLLHLAPVILLCLYWPALFISTHIPRVPNIGVHAGDHTLHFVAYFILTFLFWLATKGFVRPSLRKAAVYKVVIMFALYGVLDELTQKFVNRHCSLGDWLSDIGGIVSALVVMAILTHAVGRLVFFWGCFFVTVHWPDLFGILDIPDRWGQYRMVYLMGGYIVLTILWCQVLSWRGAFRFDRRMFLWTALVLPGYVLLDALLVQLMQQRVDLHYVVNGGLGILVGLIAVSLFARGEKEPAAEECGV